jgi:hypothetical protein
VLNALAMYIVHVCLEKVILIWCNILFNSIIKKCVVRYNINRLCENEKIW